MRESSGSDSSARRTLRRAQRTALLAEINEHILALALSSEWQALDWDFLCECGRVDCYELVTQRTDLYLSIRKRSGAVLAPGHVRCRQPL